MTDIVPSYHRVPFFSALLQPPPLLVAGKSKKAESSKVASSATERRPQFPFCIARNGTRITKNEGQDCVQIVKGRRKAKEWVTKSRSSICFAS
ncbi:hypothetical protein COCMIDRAFT_40386 [Bipolaris oryzae ATCC 44560]|uniref:Uncharacterized protein n=1 Tax=Bipolaris oryzae ATCC 44560 TaxID=930090 RepID=W6YV82_COCMI|nr:uncharacterized protein COCMIDRAFT_40386 [Bipolaris oryzae ATCC 44560]EUC41450.1 hypothetical protein COCMIDRAFT_40386 [Bipolaris oryzae ATCC 44560]